MESFERVGAWWLPEYVGADRQAMGTLSFDPRKGGRLALVIHNDIFGPFLTELPDSIDIMHGLVQGNPVTLRGCFVTNKRHSIPGYDEAEFVVDYIVTGHHFCTAAEIRVNRVTLSYTHLDNWMQKYGFGIFRVETPSDRGDLGRLSYSEYKPIRFNLDSEVAIEFGYDLEQGGTLRGATFTNGARVSLIAQTPMHIEEFDPYITFHLRNFLTLATGRANYPENIVASTEESERPISLYFLIHEYETNSRWITPYEMLFDLEEVENELETHLTTWVRNSLDLWSAYDQYFKLYFQKCLDVSARFTFLAQALEVYHKRVIAGNDKRNPALEDRITEICQKHEPGLSNVLGELVGSICDFRKKVAKTRHNLTHHPKKHAPGALKSPAEQKQYIRRMAMLLRICFLSEMDFPSDKIGKLMTGYPAYSTLIEQIKKGNEENNEK